MTAPVRRMRVMQACFLAFGLAVIYMVLKLPVHAINAPNHPFEWAIGCIAAVCILLGFNVRRFMRGTAARLSRNRASPLEIWQKGNVVSLAFFNACVLFGLVLHMAGSKSWVPGTLIGLGMISLGFWNPGTPPDAEALTSTLR